MKIREKTNFRVAVNSAKSLIGVKIARWVSKYMLKAYEVADPKLQKRKAVSHQHIRRVYFRAEGLEQRCENCRCWFNAVKYPACPKCHPEPVTEEQV